MEAIQDDLDQELLPLFLEEADELYPQIGLALQAWREQPEDTQRARKLQRILHTFKGSARMAGAMRIGELAHLMEDILGSANPARQAVLWDDLSSCLAQAGQLLGQLRDDSNARVPRQESVTPAQMTAVAPFSSIGKRLYRIVRETGKELGKKANLELRGVNIALERSVLDRMTAPFEHLLRNAMAHGLESPEQRESTGKPPIGDIRLSLRRDSNEIVFEFMDDGGGLNLDGLRRTAVGKGLLAADAKVSDKQLMQMIFVPGLSTASEVTEIAGRGVGMDVVRNEIVALGGRIEVSSKPGEGTRFTMHLPVAG